MATPLEPAQFVNTNTGNTATLAPDFLTSNDYGVASAKAGWTAANNGTGTTNPTTRIMGGQQQVLGPDGNWTTTGQQTGPTVADTGPVTPAMQMAGITTGSTKVNTLTAAPAQADANDTATALNQREQDIIAQQQKNLTDQFSAEQAGINADYDNRTRQLSTQQDEENKTSSATQFRLGRAATPYADDAQVKLNQLHNEQMNELSNQRAALVAKARAAYNSGNIQLAKDALKADEDLYSKQQELKKQQSESNSRAIQDAINLTTLGSKQSEQGRTTIDNLAKSGITIDQLSPEEITQYEKQAGLPSGTFEAYYDATYSAQQAKNQNELVDAQNKLVSLLGKIPPDQTIKIGDATYTGMQSISKDIKTVTETDSVGNVTQVYTRINPDTGQPEVVGSVSLGKIGKGKNASTPKPAADKYSTKPDEKGTIHYYYGTQEITPTAYYKGTSKSKDALTSGGREL